MGRILLVRHGQASWGAVDYDVLSDQGEQQAVLLGTAMNGLRPDVVVSGTMRRQVRTAEIAAEAAGWNADLTTDEAWNEMDHLAVLAAQPHEFDGDPDKQQFQTWFEAATRRWTGGEYDEEYEESWPVFHTRVQGALQALGDAGTAVVVTSGGPISAVVRHLVAGGAETYRRLAPVVVNSSVTRIVTGRRGMTMVTFNEHTHLDGTDLLTYR